MKILKNTVLALALSMGLVQSQANAGLVIGAIAGQPLMGVGVGAGSAVLLGVVTGGFNDDLSQTIWASLFLLPSLVLEQEIGENTTYSQLEQTLSKALPMIDDREVISDIAKQAYSKILASGTTLQKNEKRVIRFSDAEIEALLAPIALSGAERDEVNKVLR